MSKTASVAIALGSNLGDRDGHLDFALARLAALLPDLRVSSRYDTAPVDVEHDQPRYLNAAAVGHTTLTPRELLLAMQDIESMRGRQRPYTNAPRTLDLDLILYDDCVIDDGTLAVPHPRFRLRTFVLQPLAEIAPEMVDPISGLSVQELFSRLVSR